MPYYALIEGGRVVGRSFSPEALSDPRLREIASFDAAQMGDNDNGDGTFTAPAAVPDPKLWHVSVGAFKDRFGVDGPAIYASTHPICKGVVGLLEGRQRVDLKRPLVAQMLDAMIAAGQPAADPAWPGSGPMTAEKRDAILNTPPLEDERP